MTQPTPLRLGDALHWLVENEDMAFLSAWPIEPTPSLRLLAAVYQRDMGELIADLRTIRLHYRDKRV